MTATLEIRGYPENQARETRVRVLSAIYAVGLVPLRDVCVRQSETPLYARDAGIALAMLGVDTGNKEVFGNLTLGGTLKVFPGLLQILSKGAGPMVVPVNSSAALLGDCDICEAHTLRELVAHFTSGLHLSRPMRIPAPRREQPTFADIKDLFSTLADVTSALDRREPVMLIGPPGVGKTMIARRVVSLMPPLLRRDALQIAVTFDAVGQHVPSMWEDVHRPFRAPHHTCSVAAIRGNGTRPGELDLARHGVLFLDELPEFRRDVVAAVEHRMRADPDLYVIAAANPCPCGWAGTPRGCLCTARQIAWHGDALKSHLFRKIEVESLCTPRWKKVGEIS